MHQNTGAFSDLSPPEAEKVLGKYQAWIGGIAASGKLVGSDKLKEEGGKVVTSRNGRISVMDGPYAEAKEVLGGYILVRANSYEEALELARESPHLDFGRIEIRETDPMGCGEA